MSGAVSARLPGDRLHLQHGPIDLVIGVDGAREAAFAAAEARFGSVLEELVAELPLLRLRVGEPPSGAVATRMYAAAWPHGARRFVTPMAAVAGAVADEVLGAMRKAASLRRAYVNNGGDIALWLAGGETYRTAIAGRDGTGHGSVTLGAGDGVGGIATSGQGGRSLSLGIADSVTVLAATAAAADAAATLIANAVDLPGHPAIRRAPALSMDPDSDLGERLAVVACGLLQPGEKRDALSRGFAVAREMRSRGLIAAAFLTLQGETALLTTEPQELCDA